jgi:hypothetical protein
MRRVIVIALVAFLAGSAVSVAATGWRVVARANGSGTFAVANASASVDKPAAVGLRVLGVPHEVTWSIACAGEIKRAIPNRIYTLGVANSKDCNVSVFGTGEGKASIQVLVRRR